MPFAHWGALSEGVDLPWLWPVGPRESWPQAGGALMKPHWGVYGTSDANPSRVHVTVPKAARLSRRKPKWIVIHRATCRRRMSPLESHAIRRDGATRKLSRNRCEHKSVLSVAHDGTITGRPRLGRSLWSSAMGALSCTFGIGCWSGDSKTGELAMRNGDSWVPLQEADVSLRLNHINEVTRPSLLYSVGFASAGLAWLSALLGIRRPKKLEEERAVPN